MRSGELHCGQIVFSKHGRDQGRAFVIISLEGEYVYIADGTLRKLEKPKKKKIKHIQSTGQINLEIKNKIDQASPLTDAAIRKALAEMGYSSKA